VGFAFSLIRRGNWDVTKDEWLMVSRNVNGNLPKWDGDGFVASVVHCSEWNLSPYKTVCCSWLFI
jgi:hypothetical protein